MPKFRKKPVVIEAIKYTGINEALQAEYEQFVGQSLEVRTVGNTLCLVIPTLEGEHIASPGDMIIKGVAGECYPCKPDIFAKTYDEVAETPQASHAEVSASLRAYDEHPITQARDAFFRR